MGMNVSYYYYMSFFHVNKNLPRKLKLFAYFSESQNKFGCFGGIFMAGRMDGGAWCFLGSKF